jgi:hypothetical protein
VTFALSFVLYLILMRGSKSPTTES